MTKKIRLMEDEASKDEVDTQSTLDQSSGIDANDMVVRQLMKYLEAIDWKLWEILKVQKKLLDENEEE
jgi:hypothetical protein